MAAHVDNSLHGWSRTSAGQYQPMRLHCIPSLPQCRRIGFLFLIPLQIGNVVFALSTRSRTYRNNEGKE